jgi:hypothetical protein
MYAAYVVLPATDGREIRLRRITEPTAETEIPAAPPPTQPAGSAEINSKCSADLATA